MAKAGHVYHWKHGWIPISPEAKALVARRQAHRDHKLAMDTVVPYKKASVGPEGDPHNRGTKYDTPVDKVGMRYSGVAARDPRVQALKDNRALWDSQPTYEYQLTDDKGRKVGDLVATEQFLRSKPINKVVGGEPFREGYDPEILRTDEGDIVIDGHHRVAMHSALGHQSMGAKVLDVRGGRTVEQAAAEGVVIQGLTTQIMAKAKAAEPDVTSTLTAVAAKADGRMDGLDHRFKGATSLARKIRDKALQKGITPEQYGPQVGDALRYTMVTPEGSYTASIKEVLDDFRSRGYKVDEVKNTWPVDPIDYKGVNTTITTPDGTKFELQFHTEASLTAKNAQHKDFETARDLSVPIEVRRAAKLQMETNMRLVPKPPGVTAIKSTEDVKSSVGAI